MNRDGNKSVIKIPGYEEGSRLPEANRVEIEKTR